MTLGEIPNSPAPNLRKELNMPYLSDKYQKIIKEFEESFNRNHIAKVKNIRVRERLVIVDLRLIDIPDKTGYKMPDSIYKNVKYIRSELDTGLIFNRTYKNRDDEF